MYKAYFGATEGTLYCNRYFQRVNFFFVLVEELIKKNMCFVHRLFLTKGFTK